MKLGFETYSGYRKDSRISSFFLVTAYNLMMLVAIPVQFIVELRYSESKTFTGRLFNFSVMLVAVCVAIFLGAAGLAYIDSGVAGLAKFETTANEFTRDFIVGIFIIMFACKGFYNSFMTPDVVETPDNLKL